MAGGQYTDAKWARHTYGIREAAHFYDESSTRLQNLSNAHEDAQRVTFAPMKRCIAENSVEFFQDLRVVLWQFQRLRISNKGMFDAICFGLLDLWTTNSQLGAYFVCHKTGRRLPCSRLNLYRRPSLHTSA
jgi:hypothetical protein